MARPARVRVKICCITSHDEAAMAVEAGADALGFVAEMPSGPGIIADDEIAAIVPTVPPPVATFLLTSRTDPDAIVDHARRCGVGALQIVDAVEPAAYAHIRAGLPAIRIVQVLHVQDEAVFDQACAVAGHVDAILLDSGAPRAPVPELGGTGRVHDWGLSRRIIEAVDIPVFLAGGLRPENVGRAVQVAAPYGLDVCSGVRMDGKLHAGRLAAFLEAARTA